MELNCSLDKLYENGIGCFIVPDGYSEVQTAGVSMVIEDIIIVTHDTNSAGDETVLYLDSGNCNYFHFAKFVTFDWHK